jgi:hypothetical protein
VEIKPIPDPPPGLREAALRGTLIPFVGAGASRIAGCPNWSEFADAALRFFVDQGKFSHGQLAQISYLNPRVKLSIALGPQKEHNLPIDFRRVLYPFDARKTDDLEVAFKYFWAVRGEPLKDEHKERILLFWDRCVSWAQTVDPPPAKLLSGSSLLSCYLKSVGVRERAWLLAVAPYVSVDYNAEFFVKELARLVEVSPTEVADVLVALLETCQPVYDTDDRLKRLVTTLGGRPETRSQALRCAERLRYLPGIVGLYAQLVSNAAVSG